MAFTEAKKCAKTTSLGRHSRLCDEEGHEDCSFTLLLTYLRNIQEGLVSGNAILDRQLLGDCEDMTSP